MNEVGKVTYKITGDTSSLDTDISAAKGKFTSFGTSVDSISSKISTAFKAAAVAAGALVVSAVKTGVTYNAQMEGYLASFTTLLGDAEKAAAKVKELKDMAANTPFEMTDLAKATQTMLSFGIEANKASEMLQVLGDISQGDSAKLDSLTLAFSQMSSTGKLMGQDLLQMINAGFNPLNEIAKTTGETMGELKDRMSKGGISADEVTEAFKRAAAAGGLFYGAMDKQSKTFNGQVSTLKDNTKSFLGELTKGFTSFLSTQALPKVNKLLGDLNKDIDKVKATITAFAKVLVVAAAGLGAFKIANTIGVLLSSLAAKYTNAALQVTLYAAANGTAAVTTAALNGTLTASEIVVAALTGKITLATAAQSLWNLALAANPIGVVAIAIGALSAAIVAYAIHMSDTENPTRELKNRIKEVGEAATETAEKMKQSRDAFADSISAIDGEGTAATNLAIKLEELSRKTGKTAAEKKEMSAIVAELNGLVPDLALAYDAESDSLNKSVDAIHAYIEAKKSQAKLDAYMEDYITLSKEQADIDKEVAAAQEVLNDAEKARLELYPKFLAESAKGRAANGQVLLQYRSLEQASLDAADALKVHEENLATNQAALDENDVSIKTATESLVGWNEQQTAAATEAEALTAAQEREAEILKTLTDAQREMYESTGKIVIGTADMTAAIMSGAIDAEKAAEMYESYSEKTQNAFGKINEEAAVTASQMIENLKHNQEVVAEWADNLVILGTRGLDEGLLQQLRDAGPEAGASVAKLVKASDSEISELNRVMEEGGKTATDAMLAILGLPEVTNSGSEMVDNIAAGVDANDSLKTSTETLINNAASSASSAVANADFQSIGQSISSQIAAGISAGESEAVNAAAAVVAAAVSAAKSSLGGSSGGSTKKSNTKRNASGVAFVPADLTPAYLDYGERVLTREENKLYNAAGGLGALRNLANTMTPSISSTASMSIGDINVYVDGSTTDPTELGAQIVYQIKQQTRYKGALL